MFESQEPTKRDESLRWTTLRLFPGKKIRGWKAGPAWGFVTHHVGTSKPCKRRITQGGVPCEFCECGFEEGWTGYMPLLSEEGDRLVVVYGKDFHDRAKELPYSAPVVIKKANAKNGVVGIFRSDWTTMTCPWLVKKKKQEDIRKWLLQLWGQEDLVRHFNAPFPAIEIVHNDDDISPQLRDEIITKQSFKELREERLKKAEEVKPAPSKNGHSKEHK